MATTPAQHAESIAIADPPAAHQCNNCRHSLNVAHGLGARVHCFLIGEQMHTNDNCCRWQTRD